MTNSVSSHNYPIPSVPQRGSDSTTINPDQESTSHLTSIFDTSLSPNEIALKAFNTTSDTQPMANSKQINDAMTDLDKLMRGGKGTMAQINAIMVDIKKLVLDSYESTSSTSSTQGTNSLMLTC